MPSKMKAVDIKGGTGDADALFINADTPVPEPKECEALVRVKAFGLNRMDLLQREGKYPLPPHYPKTLGVEFSGTIESLGSSSSSDFKPGDEVFGLAYGGAYAEYIAVSTKMLLHKPAFLSWEQAAGVPETWITATQALFLVGEFSKGKTVLWHAGASGVSIAGIQLALDAGAAAVYATAGSDEKCAFIEQELGATKAFNYKHQDSEGKSDWDKQILEATGGKGVDLIIDFIGASYFQQNLNVAARDAHWVCLGMMGGSVLDGVNIGPLLFKRIRIEGTTLRSREPEYQGRLRDKLAEYIPHFDEGGKLKVLVDSVFDWEDVIKAHKLMEENKSRGKIICTISS
ncbi:zinc-binding dehydrogenase [Microdochium trichocladiopsis]|uniref:Zinc-binding dehydrogenase n=1 Tax=Microdochium trichocladiopsis TaxID=1682393 RepID=A0A9P8Y2U2_9PEZI|nr:zinc-binding dehydrogenase [Microdochium trichocladiopsis]KAH7026167.1 zinc-binding dehydrogenase [Microdochium trichocladiopsis]